MYRVSETIKYHREILGLTQPDLAKKLNTSQANISRWERGEVLPSVEFCVQIASFYGITLDELLGVNATGGQSSAFNKNLRALTDEEIEILENYRRLSADGKKLVKKMLGDNG